MASRQFSGYDNYYPARAGGGTGADTRGETLVVSAVNSLDPTLAPAAYRCDGVADNVEINAAIVAANAVGGGEVQLLEGTYTLAASVSPLSNVFLAGNGPATIIDGGIVCHAIDINGQSHIFISELSCQTTAGGGQPLNGINIHGGSTTLYIYNLHIHESDQDGIAISSADDTITCNVIHYDDIDRHGVNCDGNDVIIRNSILDNIGDDGIFFDVNSDGCYAKGNYIRSWVNEPIDDDGNNDAQSNICCPIGIPVAAWNSKGCGFQTVQEAIDHQVTNGSIEIVAGTHTVAGGVITLNAVSNLNIQGRGILVTTLSSNAAACITLAGACLNITISDLSFQTTGAGANNGIDITGASLAVFLEDLACLDCGQDAVSIAAAASEVHLHGSYLYSNIARYGLNIAGDNCMITDNRINGTGNDGIWIQAGATKNIVCLNRISGWTGEAIDWDDPDNQVDHNLTSV